MYVDEVNLLDDHIVDIILDAAASGRNVVEREGISYTHPSQFILVGTMNPEEGELRPQLLDRFGFCVEVAAEKDVGKRAALMQQREEYDSDPQGFVRRFQKENDQIAQEIMAARHFLNNVTFPNNLRTLVSEICTENHVAGHRADLVIEQGARAMAALMKHHEVTVDDIREVAWLALSHRKREPAPPPPPPPPPEHDHDHPDPPENQQDQEPAPEEHPPPEQPEPQDASQNAKTEETPPPETSEDQAEPDRQAEEQNRRENAIEQIFEVGETFKVKKISSQRDRIFRRGSGRRSRTRIAQKQGRYVKSTSVAKTGDVALDATLRAAAPYQLQRTGGNGLAVVLKPEDLRDKIREKRIGNFLLFSGGRQRFHGRPGPDDRFQGSHHVAVAGLLRKRDRIAMVSFRNQRGRGESTATSSIEMAAHLLKEMPMGGARRCPRVWPKLMR